MVVRSIECSKGPDVIECLIDDASNYGIQRTISGDDAQSVFGLLTSVFHAEPVDAKQNPQVYRVGELHCLQLEKKDTSPEDQTACYATVMVGLSNLHWGNMQSFKKLEKEALNCNARDPLSFYNPCTNE